MTAPDLAAQVADLTARLALMDERLAVQRRLNDDMAARLHSVDARLRSLDKHLAALTDARPAPEQSGPDAYTRAVMAQTGRQAMHRHRRSHIRAVPGGAA